MTDGKRKREREGKYVPLNSKIGNTGTFSRKRAAITVGRNQDEENGLKSFLAEQYKGGENHPHCRGCNRTHPGGWDSCFVRNHLDFNRNPDIPWTESQGRKYWIARVWRELPWYRQSDGSKFIPDFPQSETRPKKKLKNGKSRSPGNQLNLLRIPDYSSLRL